jgi:hypothetical protein
MMCWDYIIIILLKGLRHFILFYNRDYSIIVFQFIINPLHTSTFFFLNQKYPFSVIADTNSLNVITT